MFVPLKYFLTASGMLSTFVHGNPIQTRQTSRAQTLDVTPHQQYSSSIGVLGCKLTNVERIAYFPGWPDCTNMCKKISYQGRSQTVLHVDASGGAHDISYATYNWLVTGQTPEQDPIMGGAVAMQVEDVNMSECADILIPTGGKLAFSAPTGINQIIGCPAGSWTRQNFVLYNINTSQCTYGIDEQCSWDAATMLPVCPSELGMGAATKLTSQPVMEYQYGTSTKVLAIS